MALIFECNEYISYRINTLSFAPNFLTYTFMYNIKRQVKLLHMFTKETVCTSLLPLLLFVFLLVGSYMNWFIILKYIKIRCIQLSYCKIKIYIFLYDKEMLSFWYVCHSFHKWYNVIFNLITSIFIPILIKMFDIVYTYTEYSYTIYTYLIN